jgi:hypothetical protein
MQYGVFYVHNYTIDDFTLSGNVLFWCHSVAFLSPVVTWWSITTHILQPSSTTHGWLTRSKHLQASFNLPTKSCKQKLYLMNVQIITIVKCVLYLLCCSFISPVNLQHYHTLIWPICWMICFILFVRLSFPYWRWRRVILYTYFRLRAHSGCDRSAEDAYSSVASDPTFAFVEGPCFPTLDFVTAFWIMIAFYTLLTSLFCMYILYNYNTKTYTYDLPWFAVWYDSSVVQKVVCFPSPICFWFTLKLHYLC